MKQTLGWGWLILAGLLIGGLSGCSLAADVTPPPDYGSQRAQQQTAQAPAFPLTVPDSQLGQQIYQTYCLGCHGEQGLGDGPRAASLGMPPLSLQDAAVNEAASPQQWYQVIRDGRNPMPGFGEVLSNTDSWDVVAYLYRLGFGEENLQRGREVYRQRCENCHGLLGAGDGPGAAHLPSRLPDWREVQVLGQASVEDLVQMAKAVNMPDGSPHAAGVLPDDLRVAAVYIRWMTFDRQVSQAVQPTVVAGSSTATPMPQGAAIGGTVMNLTTGQPQRNLPLVLLGYETRSTQPVYSSESVTDDEGNYRFENLPVNDGRMYIVQTSFQGVGYLSSPVEMRELLNDGLVNRPIETYDSSEDMNHLQVSRLHIFLDFAAEDSLQVVEMFSINNPQSVTVRSGVDGHPVLQFVLPEGASDLRFDENTSSNRYMMMPNGFGVLEPILPGPGYQVLFAYELPYEDDLVLNLSMPLPVVSALVIVPEGMLSVDGPLTSMGKQTIEGQSFNIYLAENLKQQSMLELQVSGKTRRSVQLNMGSTLGFGLGLLGLSLAGVILTASYLQWRKKQQVQKHGDSQPMHDASQEELLDAIIALDDAYRDGLIGEGAYVQRREELKEQLRGMRKP